MPAVKAECIPNGYKGPGRVNALSRSPRHAVRNTIKCYPRRYKLKAFLVESLKLPIQIIHLQLELLHLTHRSIIHTKSLNHICRVNVYESRFFARKHIFLDGGV